MLREAKIDCFHRDGFAVAESVFSRGEVNDLRRSVEASLDRARADRLIPRSANEEFAPLGDLLAFPKLERIVFDDRLLGIARAVTNQMTIAYFGDSSFQVGEGSRGFHKDNTNRTDPAHPDWASPYTLLRMGIYLQDHVPASGGLKVRLGSHERCSTTTGRIYDIPVRVGDVVIWNLRLTHSGNAIRPRFAPSWFALPPNVEARLPRILRSPPSAKRLSLFITYGIDDAHLRRYVEKARDPHGPAAYLHEGWLHSGRSEHAVRVAKEKNVMLLFPIEGYGSACRHKPFESELSSTSP